MPARRLHSAQVASAGSYSREICRITCWPHRVFHLGPKAPTGTRCHVDDSDRTIVRGQVLRGFQAAVATA